MFEVKGNEVYYRRQRVAVYTSPPTEKCLQRLTSYLIVQGTIETRSQTMPQAPAANEVESRNVETSVTQTGGAAVSTATKPAKKSPAKKAAKPAAKKTAATAPAAAKPTAKKVTEAPAKKAGTEGNGAAANGAAAKKSGLRKPQERILKLLAKFEDKALNRPQISEKAPVDNACCVEYIGAVDEDRRVANDAKHFMSLISLGFVKFGPVEKDGGAVTYQITAKGKAAAAKLS